MKLNLSRLAFRRESSCYGISIWKIIYNYVQYPQVQNYADRKKEIKHSWLYTAIK